MALSKLLLADVVSNQFFYIPYIPRYHGSITRDETARLLGDRDGNYLVRKGLSQSGTFSLSFV